MTYDTDEEINAMVRQIDEMARRIGCRFIPDTRKLDAYRESRRIAREAIDQYKKAMLRT